MADITIQEVRKKYPQYSDMSDEQLADALHAKYYSDMPKDEFNQKIGMGSQQDNSQAAQQPQSLGNNIRNIASRTAMSNPITSPLAAVAQMHPVSDARDLAQGAVQGTVNAGALANKGMTALANKLLGTKLGATDVSNVASPIGSGKNTLEANLSRGIGQYAPYGAAAEIAAPASLLGQLLAGGSANAANYKEGDENLFGLLPKGRGYSALVGSLSNLLAPGALKGAEVSRPSNFLRGTLTPDQLAQNLEAAKGTKTDLGSVIGSSSLSDTYNTVIPAFPGTLADKTMKQTNQLLQSRGHDLLQKMLGENSSVDVPGQLQQALKSKEIEVKELKKQNYNDLNKAADDAGLKIGDDNLNTTAQDKLSEISGSARLRQEAPSSLVDDLKRYSSPATSTDINPATGLSITEPETLKSSDIFRGVLGDKSQQAYENNDTFQSGIYGSLKDAKNKDVEDAINNSGDDNLKTLRDKAHNFYATELAPFFDPDVLKFTHQGGDPDTMLNSFLKTSRVSDRSRLLGKLMDKMPENKQSLVPYAYYSRALNDDGTINTQKLATLHQNLGTNQENVLFKDKSLHEDMNNYKKLADLNTPAMNTMVKPKTGFMNRAFAPFATGMQGLTTGLALGGPVGGAAGLALGIGSPIIAGRYATKMLTSEPIREKLVNAMIENKAKFGTKNQTITGQALTQAIASLLQQRGQ